MKNFYDSEIDEQVPIRKDVVPEYPRWFVPCVNRWLEEFQKDGIFFINNAWEDDKNTLHVRALCVCVCMCVCVCVHCVCV